MRFLITADLHYDLYLGLAKVDETGLTSRAKDVSKVVKQLFEYAKENEIKTLFILGDVFHNRQKNLIPIDLYNLVFKDLEIFADHNIDLFILVGNHDQVAKGSHRNALTPFNNIAMVVSHPTVLSIEGIDFFFLPHEEYTESIDSLNNLITENNQRYSKSGIVVPRIQLGHCGIEGGKLTGFDTESKEPISLGALRTDEFLACYYGHYHISQKLSENARYVGAPLQHSFRDIDNKCGFWDIVVKQNNSNWEVVEKFIPTDAPEFHYCDAKDYYTGKYPEGDFVKLKNATKEDKQKFMNDLQVCNVERIDYEKSEQRLAVDLGQDKDELVDKYVNFAEKDLRKRRREKELGKELLEEEKF